MEETRVATLDTGSHSNAGRQARREAAARHERRQYAVACTPWFGRDRLDDNPEGLLCEFALKGHLAEVST